MHAVDDVSFAVSGGETLGLVGESGCGKSTLCRAILQLLEPTSGSVRSRAARSPAPRARQLRPLRREMQMIFQDPYASLNPRKRVGQIVGDPLKLHGVASGARTSAARVQELLERVGLQPRALQPLPARVLRRPAPADRGRPGAGPAAEADRRRRAGLGARRLDPGPDHQPARRPPGRVRPHLHLRRPRPRRRPPRLRPDRRDVPGQDRRDLAGRGALRQPDPPLHGGAALGGPDPATRGRTRPASRWCWRATCRARSIPRRPAASTPAAPARARSAARLEPPLRDFGGGHLAACHHPQNVSAAQAGRVVVPEK